LAVVKRAESSKLSWRRIYAYLVAPDSSIEAPLQPEKFFEGIGKGDGDISSRLAIQTRCLDQPGTSGRVPEGSSKVSGGL
jgi:hypothetical protein